VCSKCVVMAAEMIRRHRARGRSGPVAERHAGVASAWRRSPGARREPGRCGAQSHAPGR
jgi:hypothetical protein